MSFSEDLFVLANRVDLNKIPHTVTFCLGLHCLLKYVFGSLCIWISPLILQMIHMYSSLFCFFYKKQPNVCCKVLGVALRVH